VEQVGDAVAKSLLEVDGVRMPSVLARLSRTPGEVRHAGRDLGADTDEVLTDGWLARSEDEVVSDGS